MWSSYQRRHLRRRVAARGGDIGEGPRRQRGHGRFTRCSRRRPVEPADRHRPRLALVEHLEVGRAQPGDRHSLLVHDRDRNFHEPGCGAKRRWNLLSQQAGPKSRGEHAEADDGATAHVRSKGAERSFSSERVRGRDTRMVSALATARNEDSGAGIAEPPATVRISVSCHLPKQCAAPPGAVSLARPAPRETDAASRTRTHAMYLTRHLSADGPRWALDGGLLPAAGRPRPCSRASEIGARRLPRVAAARGGAGWRAPPAHRPDDRGLGGRCHVPAKPRGPRGRVDRKRRLR